MIIDLRSDTVTKPTAGMLHAMMQAEVGDDVYEEDPTVKELEKRCAEWFGMEAGLYCPSGTMTNQIAIKILTQPGDEVICSDMAHIYLYEGGGISFNSGASVKLIKGNRGRISADQVLAGINADNVHFPRTAMVSLENTMNKGGGCCYTLDQIAGISEVCKGNGIALHMDGARIFNALEFTKEDPREYGKYFDTISVCLSKGLGAPIGSVLLANTPRIKQARRFRKVFGGGMRQAGFLAASGLHALQHHVTRLAQDHARARALVAALSECSYVADLPEPETNIVIFELKPDFPISRFLAYLEENGVKASGFGPQVVRFVTHLDFTDEMLERTIDVLKAFKG
jgi:threonine aldolase